MTYQRNIVESVNLNNGIRISGYQCRCPADSIYIEGAAKMADVHFRVGDIVEITISRFEDNGRYYHTLGIVIEEPASCHGEYFILYGPFDDSFRYADFLAPENIRYPSYPITTEAKNTLTACFSQYQSYCRSSD